MARPARVRMRRRKPWVLARRRLFGWKVRLLTRSPLLSDAPWVMSGLVAFRLVRSVWCVRSGAFGRWVRVGHGNPTEGNRPRAVGRNRKPALCGTPGDRVRARVRGWTRGQAKTANGIGLGHDTGGAPTRSNRPTGAEAEVTTARQATGIAARTSEGRRGGTPNRTEQSEPPSVREGDDTPDRGCNLPFVGGHRLEEAPGELLPSRRTCLFTGCGKPCGQRSPPRCDLAATTRNEAGR